MDRGSVKHRYNALSRQIITLPVIWLIAVHVPARGNTRPAWSEEEQTTACWGRWWGPWTSVHPQTSGWLSLPLWMNAWPRWLSPGPAKRWRALLFLSLLQINSPRFCSFVFTAYLPVDCSDDCGAYIHAGDKAVLKVMVEDESLQQGCEEHEEGQCVTPPVGNVRLFCEWDQHSTKKERKSLFRLWNES